MIEIKQLAEKYLSEHLPGHNQDLIDNKLYTMTISAMVGFADSLANPPLKPLSELHKDREACEKIIARHWPAFISSVEVKRIDEAVTQFSVHNDYLAIYDSGDIFYSIEFIEFPCSAFFIVNTLKEFGYDVQPETKTT